ncbi:MAG TPA: ferrous iron transport protein B [Opitutaceae bacterium]|nr:ferrous iron transport protein B [Opitutaceae bacterium]
MAEPVFAFVGNPNCGKSTLFNALTGLRQKVGNYPGVTVEKKIGECFSQHGRRMQIIDLPGAYSLAARSPDEAVMRDVLLGRRADTPRPDRVVCIVDATNLERNLYLVSQILDLGLPVIVVLNMMDLAVANGLRIDVDALARRLGVPVVTCQANAGVGLTELRVAMSRTDLAPRAEPLWTTPAEIVPALEELVAVIEREERSEAAPARAEALLLLSDRTAVETAGVPVAPAVLAVVDRWEARWRAADFDWRGSLVAARYEAVGAIVREVVDTAQVEEGPSLSDRIDAVVVHPVWGWVTLVAVMAAMFLSIFTLAEYPMGWIDGGVSWLADTVRGAMAPGDLRDLLTDGVIAGVGGILVFLPQILILFFFIGLLEQTGYMARAAFMMDRLMSRVGLDGKSFIPLLSSYACAIPGIMATRTIESRKDRLVTILVAPLMTCSARLPVYLLLIAAIVPEERVPVLTKVGLMFAMFALGTGGAFLFAWLFKRTLLRGEAAMMILELPPYRLPSLLSVALHMGERAFMFLRKAGTVILAISIVLWALTTFPRHPDANAAEQVAQSYAGRIGHAIEPAIRPLGFDWQIGVGLITSFAAREVFVSSMAVIFNVDENQEDSTVPLRQALLAARWPDGRELFTPLVCFTLMVFYVFAMQCVSTIVVVRRETGSWRWPLLQIGYMTTTAWVVCFAVRNIGLALGFH